MNGLGWAPPFNGRDELWARLLFGSRSGPHHFTREMELPPLNQTNSILFKERSNSPIKLIFFLTAQRGPTKEERVCGACRAAEQLGLPFHSSFSLRSRSSLHLIPSNSASFFAFIQKIHSTTCLFFNYIHSTNHFSLCLLLLGGAIGGQPPITPQQSKRGSD